MATPYYQDDQVTLYLGDMRELLSELDIAPDLVVADPPYGETSLAWDRWPDGWPAAVAEVARSLWCFGSLRMFLDRVSGFSDWRLSQDVVWEKHNGSGFAADRFKRVHEYVTHWYRGNWCHIYHQVPRIPATARRGRIASSGRPEHLGTRADFVGAPWTDNGTRLTRSVLQVRSTHHAAIHPTEKPVALLRPLIDYGCPPGGLVLDPFAGSGSTAVAARQLGRRAVLIEADEAMCAKAIQHRLAQGVLPLEVAP